MYRPTDLAHTLVTWRERARFRASLGKLIEDPHLAADLGFDVHAIRAERHRLPWEPIRLRRGPSFRVAAVESGPTGPRAPRTFTPAGARRT